MGALEKHSALEQLLRNTNLEAVYSSDSLDRDDPSGKRRGGVGRRRNGGRASR